MIREVTPPFVCRSKAPCFDADTRPPRLPRIFWTRRDVILALLAGATLFIWSWQASGRLVPNILTLMNGYIQSDNARVYDNLTKSNSDHSRSTVHPLFALVCGLPTRFLQHVVGFEPCTAFRLFLASNAAIWIAGLFRLISTHRSAEF